MLLIDRYAPTPDFRERHAIGIDADPATVMARAKAFKTGNDPLFRFAMACRELPMRIVWASHRNERRNPFGLDDFTLLDANDTEIVYGLRGRFWRADFGLESIADAEDFLSRPTPGSAKLALNFAIEVDWAGRTVLSTETRIVCADRAARVRCTPYWYLVRPVSGLIRRRTLAAIRKASETASQG